MSTRGVFRFLLLVAVTAGVSLFLASYVGAQATSAYFGRKCFWLMPGGNMLPLVQGNWRVFAHAQVPGSVTVAPPPGFMVIGPQGGGWLAPASATTGWATADANSFGSVAPYGAGGPVTGCVEVWGYATVNPPWWAIGAAPLAIAQSRSGVTVRGRTRTGAGAVVLGPALKTEVRGKAGLVNVVKDPMYIEIFDLANNEPLLDAVLLDIMLNLRSPGDDNESVVEWRDTDNVLAFNVMHDADFSIVIDSPWIVQQGKLELEVRGGRVTGASKSGMFSSLNLPNLGDWATFSLQMPEIRLDYDVSSFFGDPNNPEERELAFNFGGYGEARAVIPEPVTLLLFGVGLLPVLRCARKRN